MKRKLLILSLILALVALPLVAACAKAPEAPEVIRVPVRVSPASDRAQAVNYTAPPYKYNDWLTGYRDVTQLLMTPETTALVNIDIQNIYSNPEAIWFCGPRAPGIIPYVNKLANYFREHNMPVIWVQNISQPDGIDTGMGGKYFPELMPPDSIVAPNQYWSELDPALNNQPGDIYVTKPKLNAFYAGNLEGVLDGLGIESIVFTGLDESACVFATLVEAFHRDYNCILAEDATAGSYWPHEDWMAFVEMSYARVLTADEVIAELAALAP